MRQTVVILGATSDIARALCRELARQGATLILAGRRGEELEQQARELRDQFGTQAYAEMLDILAYPTHAQFVTNCLAHAQGKLDGVVVCFGILPNQAAAQRDRDLARQTIDINFTSAAVLLEWFAEILERQRHGFLAAISSVAGDRGRQSNYTYGAAKAGLSAFLQGLRNRLYPAGVRVLTIKPGFVTTRMTIGRIDPKSPLTAPPEQVARDIARALARRRDVIYTPWFWRVIMAIVTRIPEAIFKRLRL